MPRMVCPTRLSMLLFDSTLMKAGSFSSSCNWAFHLNEQTRSVTRWTNHTAVSWAKLVSPFRIRKVDIGTEFNDLPACFLVREKAAEKSDFPGYCCIQRRFGRSGGWRGLTWACWWHEGQRWPCWSLKGDCLCRWWVLEQPSQSPPLHLHSHFLSPPKTHLHELSGLLKTSSSFALITYICVVFFI